MKTYRLDYYKNGKPETVIGGIEYDYGPCIFMIDYYKQTNTGFDAIQHVSGDILHRVGGSYGENAFLRYFGGIYEGEK